jgi:hypothetical protein
MAMMTFDGKAGGIQFGFAPSDREPPIQERRDYGIECLVDQAERRQLLAIVDLKWVSIKTHISAPIAAS